MDRTEKFGNIPGTETPQEKPTPEFADNSAQNWQISWEQAAQQAEPKQREFMLEFLARWREMYPDDDGVGNIGERRKTD